MLTMREKNIISIRINDNSFLIKKFRYEIENKDNIHNFSKDLLNLILQKNKKNSDIVFVCIGTDRVIGDALGPYIGTKLVEANLNNVYIYGTLECPVHATNLDSIYSNIKENHKKAIIIAIDASLGLGDEVENVYIANQKLWPGSGVGKNLTPIGDVSITGVVNVSSNKYPNFLLQNMSFNTIYKLSDFISKGIIDFLNEYENLLNKNIKEKAY